LTNVWEPASFRFRSPPPTLPFTCLHPSPTPTRPPPPPPALTRAQSSATFFPPPSPHPQRPPPNTPPPPTPPPRPPSRSSVRVADMCSLEGLRSHRFIFFGFRCSDLFFLLVLAHCKRFFLAHPLHRRARAFDLYGHFFDDEVSDFIPPLLTPLGPIMIPWQQQHGSGVLGDSPKQSSCLPVFFRPPPPPVMVFVPPAGRAAKRATPSAVLSAFLFVATIGRSCGDSPVLERPP